MEYYSSSDVKWPPLYQVLHAWAKKFIKPNIIQWRIRKRSYPRNAVKDPEEVVILFILLPILGQPSQQVKSLCCHISLLYFIYKKEQGVSNQLRVTPKCQSCSRSAIQKTTTKVELWQLEPPTHRAWQVFFQIVVDKAVWVILAQIFPGVSNKRPHPV